MANEIQVAVDATGVAVVTLNRPEKRNVVSLAMWRGLGEIYRDLGRRSDVRVVILTGAGGHFCGGADISEFARVRNTVEDAHAYGEAGHAATQAIIDLPQPTIAAVHGYGVGGGCGLALACDLRVGDATTQMGIPAARLSIVYSTLDCSLLLRAVGLANAKLVLYSGRYFPLADCRAMGLIDAVAEPVVHACPAVAAWRQGGARSAGPRRGGAARRRDRRGAGGGGEQRGLPRGAAGLPGKAHAHVQRTLMPPR